MGHHPVPANVELLTVVGMGEGRVGQFASVGSFGVAVGALETVVQSVLFGFDAVLALAVARPGAGAVDVVVN